MSVSTQTTESKSPPVPPWKHSYEEFIEKFPEGKTPREAQIETFKQIQTAFAAGKKFAVVEMPTGGGKSFVAKAAADVVAPDGGAYMITAQIPLQDQYARDFPAPQMELLKGRRNYQCNHEEATPDMMADKGVCKKIKKAILPECVDMMQVPPEIGRGLAMAAASKLALPASAHHCPYWNQLQKCSDSLLTLFNFSSFLFQRRIGRFQKRALLLLDEGHNIEGELMRYVTVTLTEHALSAINLKIDRDITSKEQFVDWLREQEVLEKVASELEWLDDDECDLDVDAAEAVKETLMDLQGKLELFLGYLNQTEWILSTTNAQTYGNKTMRQIEAKPLFAKSFANDLLFKHADRVIIFSATILNVQLWAKNLGIDMAKVAHITTPCDFPEENRPIHLEFCGNMGRKHFSSEMNPSNPTQPKFVAKVKQLLARHKGQRGLIHCHSFALSKVLREEVGSDRFLFQDQFGGNKQAMMDAHAKSPDSVIVAPAMAEGFDFKDGLARFQIIAKVPWPSLNDKLIKERASRSDEFYGWLTALKLVQSTGRIVRSTKDWGYTYIIDGGFSYFFKIHGTMIPRWIQNAFSRYAPNKEIRQA